MRRTMPAQRGPCPSFALNPTMDGQIARARHRRSCSPAEFLYRWPDRQHIVPRVAPSCGIAHPPTDSRCAEHMRKRTTAAFARWRCHAPTAASRQDLRKRTIPPRSCPYSADHIQRNYNNYKRLRHHRHFPIRKARSIQYKQEHLWPLTPNRESTHDRATNVMGFD